MANISLNALYFWSNHDRMQARKSGLGHRGLNIGSVIYHYNRKTWRQTREEREEGGREEKAGGRVGVVMLGRSPYLQWSDWWGWGISPVMVQLHQLYRMCMKDRAGEYRLRGWSDSCRRKALQNKWCYGLDLVTEHDIISPVNLKWFPAWVHFFHAANLFIKICVSQQGRV